jgi:steroid delta-isomerase-like uncharacterized protein
MTDHKALVQSLYDELVPGADLSEVIDRYFADDFVENEAFPGQDNTRETPKQMFAMVFAAFPDFRATVHDIIQDGDKVAVRLTFGGTHQGEFMGVPASGNHAEFSVIDIHQFRGDTIVAHWGITDMAALMAQIGPASD